MMTTVNEVVESPCNLNVVNSSGGGAGPQDAGSSTEETSLQSGTGNIFSPPSKHATGLVQDPTSESSSKVQAERTTKPPPTEPGAPHLPEKPLTESKQNCVGSFNPENTWLTEEDISTADKAQERRIPRGAHWTNIRRQLVNPTLGTSNKRFEAKDRYLNVRGRPTREKTGKPVAVAVKERGMLRDNPETHGARVAKQKGARDAALKRLNLGADADWPDESQILDQIWRQQNKTETTQLEWQIDKRKKLDIHGSGKSVKQCVVATEVDTAYIEDKFSNTEGVTGLNIISGPLQEILRQVIIFDPSVSLYKDPISFYKPFGALFHNMPALEKYSLRADADELGTKDLRVLLYICKKVFARLFESIHLSLAAGDVFGEALTALYRPGTLLLAKDIHQQPHVFMCLSARFEEHRYGGGEFLVRTWYMQWNHLYQRLERRLAHFSLGQYAGTRKIKELPIYPLDYYGTDTAQRDLKARMIERNRRWTRILRKKASCWKHEGLALRQLDGTMIKHHGRVVVEEDQALSAINLFTDARITSDVHVRYWDSRPEYLCCEKLAIDVELTNDQLLLCTSAVWCFNLQEQTSLLVSTSDLQPVDWNKSAMNHLVLDQDKKDLICAVVKNHSKDSPSQTQDIIEGKGSGLVIVLHGPPGVGKTLTAECVAEYAEKPLIALRISDLVTRESTFTQSLTRRLQDADKLGAIILLDEADVILESRSFEDVKRNGIVSAFLRTLEYFDGIIIMTTNRMQTMDVAFQSRIQVAIEYKNLNTSSRRKIWRMFINRLENTDAKEELLDEMEYLKKSNMNGRQIRSVMKVSESLAKSDGREYMSVAHVKRAVETASLQRFFDQRKEVSRRNLRVSLQGTGQDSHGRDEEDEEEDDED